MYALSRFRTFHSNIVKLEHILWRQPIAFARGGARFERVGFRPIYLVVSSKMEVKIWLPDFLSTNANHQVIWDGPENVPLGTILHPYQGPKLESLTFTDVTEIPEKLKQVPKLISPVNTFVIISNFRPYKKVLPSRGC